LSLQALYRALPGQFLQFREWRIGSAGTGLAGVFDDAVEPAVDEEKGAFARLAVAAIGFAWAEPKANHVAQPSADDALDRLGHDGVAHADGVVEVGPHERNDFAPVVVGKGLVGDAAVVGKSDGLAVVAGGTGRKRHRQQHHRRNFG